MKYKLMIFLTFLIVSSGFAQSKNIIGLSFNTAISPNVLGGIRPELSYERVLNNKWSAFTTLSISHNTYNPKSIYRIGSSTTYKNTDKKYYTNSVFVDLGTKYTVIEKNKFQVKLKAGATFLNNSTNNLLLNENSILENKSYLGVMGGAEVNYIVNNRIDVFADFKAQIYKGTPNTLNAGIGLKIKFGK